MNTWQIQEKEWDSTQYEKYETLFALSNGYMGVRGGFEEDGIDHGHDGFYMNGFYETYPIRYGEAFSGYPSTSQAMVNLPNPKRLKLTIDGEPFSLLEKPPLEYKRTLHMKSALLSRNLICPSGNGKKIRIESERFVSAVHKNLFCLTFRITALENDCMVGLSSGYDLDSHNLSKKEDPRIGVEFTEPPVCKLQKKSSRDLLSLKGEIRHSGLSFSSTISHKLEAGDISKRENLDSDSFFGETWHFRLQAGETAVLEKFVLYEKAAQIANRSTMITTA